MGSMERELEAGLKIAEKKFEKDLAVNRFLSIQADFEKLVAKGFAKKRGNNAFSVIDAHLKPKTSLNNK